jgi:2-amino-4-hydroxy-6-hydroxymethyldihydropteridine diphosphokinase
MANMTRQAFIGVGANLGDRWATIRGTLELLAHTSGILAVEQSAVYETVPVGVTDQPKFLNLVAGIETTLTPEQLLALLHALEDAAGRRRPREIRWGPRTLDLDILLYEGEDRADIDLVLPHPRMWERAFVLVPLKELLDRSECFDRPVWTDLRARLAALNLSDAGVKRWDA